MKGASPSRRCGEFTASGIENAKMEGVVFIYIVRSGKL